MKRGTISCDQCKVMIASIKCSNQIMENLENHPCEILCTDCRKIPQEELEELKDK